MAQSDAITHDQIAEEGVIRDYLGAEFETLINVTLPAAQEAMRQTAKVIQMEFTNLKMPTNAAELDALNEKLEKTRRLELLDLDIKKKKLDVDAKIATANKKAQADADKKLKDDQKQSAQTQKTIKENQKLNDVYEQAKVRLGELSKQLKTLSVAGQDGAVSTQILRKEFNDLKDKVDIAEHSVGQFQRNVGNYPGAVNKYEVSLTKLAKGLRGLGGLGRLVSSSLGIDPEVFLGLQEAGRAIKEIHHVEGLSTAVKTEQTAATQAHTVAVEEEIVVEKEESAVSNVALGIWGLVVVAIGAAVYAIYEWTKATGDATEAWANQNTTIKEFRQEVIKLNEEFEKSSIQLDLQNKRITEYQAAQKLGRLKEMQDVGGVAKKVREETKKIEEEESGFWISVWRHIKNMGNPIGAEVEKALAVAEKVSKLQDEAKKVITAQEKVQDITLALVRKQAKGKMDDDFETSQAKLKLLEEETTNKKEQLDIQLQMDLSANKHSVDDLEIRTVNSQIIWQKYYKAVAQMAFDHEAAMKKIADETINQTNAELTKKATGDAKDALEELNKNKKTKKEKGLFGDVLKTTNAKYDAQQDEATTKEKEQERIANDTITNTEELNAKTIQLQKDLDNQLTDIDRARYEELFSLEDLEKERKKKLHAEEMKRLKEISDTEIEFIEQSLARKNELEKAQLEVSSQMHQDDVLQQQQLAADGLKNHLADSRAQLAADELARQKEAEKIKKQEETLAFLKLFSAYAEKGDPDGALGKALLQMGLAESVTNGFYEGTKGENVAADLGAPKRKGKDGYDIRVDGSEKVFNPSDSALIPKGMSNRMVAKIARAYQMGYLPEYKNSQIALVDNSAAIIELNRKFDTLTEVVKNRPVRSFKVDPQGNVTHEEFLRGLMRANTQKRISLNYL